MRFPKLRRRWTVVAALTILGGIGFGCAISSDAISSVLAETRSSETNSDPLPPNRSPVSQPATRLDAARTQAAMLHNTVGGASSEDLRQHLQSSDLSLSIQAAWERVRRTVSKEPLEDVVAVNPLEINRFLGFLEAKLGTRPPEWWEKPFQMAQAQSRKAIDLPRFELMELSYLLRDQTQYGVMALLDMEIAARKYDGKFGGLWDVPRILEKHLDGGQLFDGTVVDINFANDYAYLVFFDHSASQSFPIICINRMTGDKVWSNVVHGSGRPSSTIGISQNYARLQLEDETIFVFGHATYGTYAEAFDAKDGTRRLLFTTVSYAW